MIEVTDMTDTPREAKSGLAKRLPLLVILVVAAIGAFTLKDFLSFQALADNREMLIGFRDNNYLLTVLAFMAAYVVIVAFAGLWLRYCLRIYRIANAYEQMTEGEDPVDTRRRFGRRR